MRPNLLIIDDDEHLGMVLKRVLRGYDLELVTTAEEGLERVAERSFDAILCDLALPGKSGVDFFTRVAQLRPGQEGRVRFITGGATDDATELFITRNPNAVLHKPFELDRLRQFVTDVVNEPPRASAF